MQEILVQPWFKYVVGGIAIAFFIFKHFNKGVQEAKNEPAKFSASKTSDLTENQLFSMALDSVMTAYWEVDSNTLSFTKNGKTPMSFKKYMKGWFIDTRDGYLSLTDHFLNHGRRGYLNTIYPIFKNEPKNSWEEKMAQAFPNGNDRAYKILDKFDKYSLIDELKSKGIIEFDSDIEIGALGYDVGMAIGQARRAFTAELISEKEAWDIINTATELAKQNFTSWDDFGKSHMIGYALDVYKLKGWTDYYQEYIHLYKSIKENADSPWNTLEWQS